MSPRFASLAALPTGVVKSLPLLVPLGVALVMAIIFRQPAFLVFGLMAPLLSAGQLLAKKHEAARTAERETLEHDEEAARSQESARVAVSRWREDSHQKHPDVSGWLANPLWRPVPLSQESAIRIGCAPVTPPQDVGWPDPVAGIPVTIPLLQSLAVVGSGREAWSVWRAMYCQALAVVTAHPATLATPLTDWRENDDTPTVLDIPHPAGHSPFRWSLSPHAGDISADVTWVVAVASETRVSVYHRGVAVWSEVEPDTLSFAMARWVRARLFGSRAQQTEAAPALDPEDRGALWCEVGRGAPPVDLVRAGPHGVVWGKTGSGKSVLIQRLVVSLCTRYTPMQVSVVGIDFKGGATLSPLTRLPHVQGLLTDLTPRATDRVTRSLRAELRRREQLFADGGVSTWVDLPDTVPCPRILIVVDEAGVVHSEAPELMAVLSDVAGRGRSLGLHLLLATQRPQHLPRNIIANCPLRLCLTVTDQEEASQYLPDVPRHLLTSLLTGPPGTVLHPTAHAHPQLTTIQPVGSDEVAAIIDRRHPPGRRLWQAELPAHVGTGDVSRPADTPPGEYLMGLGDYPDTQSHEAVWFCPASDGPLVIVGESGSGHTWALSSLAAQADRAGLPVVWSGGRVDVLCDDLLGVTRRTAPVLVVIDRLDRILAGSSHETQAWVVDTLQALSVRLGQSGPGAGLVLTSAPGSSVLSMVSRWATSRCLLRHRDGDQWVQSGGDPALHDPRSGPGRGVWEGEVMQWAVSDGHPRGQADGHRLVPPAPPGARVVCGTASAGQEQRGVWSVATAEASWNSLRQAMDAGDGVVFQAVSVPMMRQLIGPGQDYPPVATTEPYGWLVSTGGCVLVKVRHS